MPTRRQNGDEKEFRQYAFASSAEYERGILGNLVAARCHKLTDSEEIAVLWWLQQVSWRDGGLEKFAREFLAKHPLHVTEFDAAALLGGVGDEPHAREMSAGDFAEAIRIALVDPSSPSLRHGLKASGYFQPQGSLWDALATCRARETEIARGRIVETAVTRQIFEELDFALETRSFVLIEGREGIGKSEAARAWCDAQPGRAVYVRLEAGSDETTLYRSIARRIGTACSYQRKAVEMRARIQDALQAGHMALVLDEAHFLWPQADRSERSVPKRMDWVRTALVDFGVPIALVSTPQHFSRQCDRYRRAGWNANQVERRLARTACLPEEIEAEDAIAVARSHFPEASTRLLKRTAGVALLDVARLTMFSHLRKRVDFLASRRSGLSRPELLELALEEIGAPGAGGAATTPANTASGALQPQRNGVSGALHDTSPALASRLSNSVQLLEPSAV